MMTTACAPPERPISPENPAVEPLAAENENTDGPIKVYYEKQKISNLDMKNSWPRAVSTDKIWYFRYNDFADEEHTLVNYKLDLGDSEIFYDDEQSINENCYLIRTSDKAVYLYSDENGDMLCSKDFKNGKTESVKPEEWPEYKDTDSDGNIYFYSHTGKLYVYDKDLKLKKTVLAEKMLLEHDMTFIYGMAVSDDGKVFLADSNKEDIVRIFYLETNGEIKELPLDFSPSDCEIENLFTDKNGNLVLEAYGENYVIDSETGSLLSRYSLSDVYQQIGPSGKYDMVYQGFDGVYGYDHSKESSDLLISEEKIPGVSDYLYGVHLTGNTLYLSVGNNAGSEELVEFDRNTGKETVYESDGYCRRATVSSEGVLYYMTDLSVFRLESDGTSRLVFSLSDSNPNLGCWATGFEISDNGDFLVSSEDEENNRCVIVFDGDGKEKKRLYQQGIYNDGTEYFMNLAVHKNEKGELFITADKEVYRLENETYELQRCPDVDGTEMSIMFYNGNSGYDLFFENPQGIYGWKAEGNVSEELINWKDAEIRASMDFIVASPDELLLPDGEALKKADAARISKLNSKKLITVATLNGEYIKHLANDFNSENSDCRILIKDYLRREDEIEDVESASLRLAEDMKNGSVPDIVMFDDLDLSEAVLNGKFEDLKKYVENDPELNMSDFRENIIEEFTYNGCLYTIPACFKFDSLFTAFPVSEWDYDDLISAPKTTGHMFELWMADIDTLVNILVGSYAAEHVDLKNRKCDFENDNFAGLLEFVRDNSYEVNDDNHDYFGDGFDIYCCSVDTFNDYITMTMSDYEKMYPSGFPSSDKSRNSVIPGYSFGISSDSECKEEAWKFIRTVLKEDAFDYFERYSDEAYIRKSVVEEDIKQEETYLERFNRTDDVDIDEYREFINRPVFSDTLYRGVMIIVNKEVKPFFEGDISAEEAAENIQTKVTGYLNSLGQ